MKINFKELEHKKIKEILEFMEKQFYMNIGLPDTIKQIKGGKNDESKKL